MITVSVDEQWCCASGACALTCPEVFDQDESGLVVLRTENPPDELGDKVRDAASLCPSAVITVQSGQPANHS